MIDHPVIDNDDAYDNDYDRVTARDIADLLHHHAQLRYGPRGDDPATRAAFLHHKAELFTRIAEQAARTRVDAYVEQVRQMARHARAAADQADLQLPHQRGDCPIFGVTGPTRRAQLGGRSSHGRDDRTCAGSD